MAMVSRSRPRCCGSCASTSACPFTTSTCSSDWATAPPATGSSRPVCGVTSDRHPGDAHGTTAATPAVEPARLGGHDRPHPVARARRLSFWRLENLLIIETPRKRGAGRTRNLKAPASTATSAPPVTKPIALPDSPNSRTKPGLRAIMGAASTQLIAAHDIKNTLDAFEALYRQAHRLKSHRRSQRPTQPAAAGPTPTLAGHSLSV